MATYAQRLASVQAAIDEILTSGQSWRYGDRQYTAADLGALRALELQYTANAATEARAGIGSARITLVTPL